MVLETELRGFRALTHHFKTKPYCHVWALLMDRKTQFSVQFAEDFGELVPENIEKSIHLYLNLWSLFDNFFTPNVKES